MKTGRDSTIQFLQALFPEVPDDGAILIWRLMGRRSSWATDISTAADMAIEAEGDVYVGACLGPRTGINGEAASRRRATIEQVTYMPGVWLDIDYGIEAHKKEGLPPDQKAAYEVLGKMPLKPTALIHSGHGLQAWWLFPELLALEEPETRQSAIELSAGWSELFKKHSKASGWGADSVGDLARVMRAPGTTNFKGSKPVGTKLLALDDTRRYDPEALSEFTPIPDPRAVPLSVIQGGGTPRGQLELSGEAGGSFSVQADANPPFDKFQAAQANLDGFKDTWERKRKDMQDQSHTGYEMALANFGTLAGWTDQEIVDLLIAYRRKHGAPPKLRVDYFVITIRKARRLLEQSEAEERLSELSEMCGAAAERGEKIGDGERGETFRAEALSTLSDALGITITAIEKTMAEEPLFFLRTPTGGVQIGTISAIHSQRVFRERIMVATNQVPRKIKKKEWEGTVLQVILNATVEIDVGPEATTDGMGRYWIRSYLADYPPQDLDRSPEDMPALDYPTVRCVGGVRSLIVESRHFLHWLSTAAGCAQRVTTQRLGVVLRAVGGESRAIKVAGKTARRWVFDLTDEILPETQPGGNGAHRFGGPVGLAAAASAATEVAADTSKVTPGVTPRQQALTN